MKIKKIKKNCPLDSFIQGSHFWLILYTNERRRVRLWLDKTEHQLKYQDSDRPGQPSGIQLIELTDVRYGFRTDILSEACRSELTNPKKPHLVEERCFSLIYGAHRQTVDFQSVECSARQALVWYQGLKYLIQSLQLRRAMCTFLRHKFHEADADHSEALDFEEVRNAVHNLGIRLPEKKIQTLFDLANVKPELQCGQEVLDFEEFVKFYNLLAERSELAELFNQYDSNRSGFLTADQLRSFLVQEQGVDPVNAGPLVEHFMTDFGVTPETMSLEGFTLTVTSRWFGVEQNGHRRVNQIMDRPLSHYLVSSSHNTYLTGHQLIGQSKIEAYISALEKGCRCLELDLWDGKDNQPVIHHGGTLTSKIYARDVLKNCIRPYAFDHSSYPLILSIENHLSEPQEHRMALDLEEIFGKALYKGDVSQMTQLPSPHELRFKVIIKANRDKIKAKNFRHLVNICTSVKFHSLEASRCHDQFFNISSLSEDKARRLVRNSRQELIRHTRKQLMRIYPSFIHIGSGNFDPIPYWNSGMQLVALNYQTGDPHLTANLGLFRRNGNCGFVLKPDRLVEPETSTPRPPVVIQMRVISGQNLPRIFGLFKSPTANPYVRVQLDDGNGVVRTFETHKVPQNGLSPIWNVTFNIQVLVPELAIITWTVLDVDIFGIGSDVLGTYALPVESLASGYRHVPLATSQGDHLPGSSLFIHSKFK